MSEVDDLFEGYGEDVGLDPEDKKFGGSGKSDWFKGEKGRQYRVALLYFHPLNISAMRAAKKKNPEITRDQLVEVGRKILAKRAEELGKAVDQLGEHEKLHTGRIQFHMTKAYYHEVAKFVPSRLGLDGPEADKVWRSLGDEKTYFTTVVLVYPTVKNGEVDKDRLAKDWEVFPWRFSGKVYDRLHAIRESLASNQLNIATQDIKLKCTNTDYQNFDIDSAGKAIWTTSDKFRDVVLAEAVKLYDKMKKPFKAMSTADLRIKLGLDSGNVGSDVADDDEFEDVLNDV